MHAPFFRAKKKIFSWTKDDDESRDTFEIQACPPTNVFSCPLKKRRGQVLGLIGRNLVCDGQGGKIRV